MEVWGGTSADKKGRLIKNASVSVTLAFAVSRETSTHAGAAHK